MKRRYAKDLTARFAMLRIVYESTLPTFAFLAYESPPFKGSWQPMWERPIEPKRKT